MYKIRLVDHKQREFFIEVDDKSFLDAEVIEYKGGYYMFVYDHVEHYFRQIFPRFVA